MTKTEAIRRIDILLSRDNNDIDATATRIVISEAFDDFENDIKTAVANEHETLVMFYEDKLLECENDIKVITIDIKKRLAIAYMEGGSAMKDYFERIGEING